LTADFHELPTSPTIDAGTAGPLIGTLDLDRAARIQRACVGGSATPDIGAYELTPPAAKCSTFTIGKLKLNKRKGTGKLTVSVPGAGILTGTGKGLTKRNARPNAAGDVVLNVKASGKAKRKLNDVGKAKLKILLSWTATGAAAATQRTRSS
jgi:hypothetical protein